MEGTYKGYKSAECIMAGMHDFTCYLKRGFGRATFHASIDVRNGLLTRAEGMELAKRYDPEIPEALKYYLGITGLTEKDFFATMRKLQIARLRRTAVPVKKKLRKNKENIYPAVQQLIDKNKDRNDIRDL
jgi:hypothetical protein